ncbi:helix-turn-helix domain-containing protein [Paenibacillus humicus]|uniref:helix-turn-helix domain-containing protein n=1 Tax=Paenibacillus humicus TaxID=412861 RepID=UPI0027D974E1|nr:helix-turn-helix transcriptional regulator [Paenibacillus humicus]
MKTVAIVMKLNELLDANNITKNALAREAKVRPNLIYELCENKTKRIELDNFEKIIRTLKEMTGKQIEIQDLMKYED